METKREMSFEEYLRTISILKQGDIENYVSSGNVFVEINTSPTNVRDGLIKHGKFKLKEYDPEDQGKFHLNHIETEALVLVKYEGVNEDTSRKKWREPEPNESQISIHPGYSRELQVPSFIAKRVLPDVLEFGKSEKVGLRGFWKLPIVNGRKREYEEILVRYAP